MSLLLFFTSFKLEENNIDYLKVWHGRPLQESVVQAEEVVDGAGVVPQPVLTRQQRVGRLDEGLHHLQQACKQVGVVSE